MTAAERFKKLNSNFALVQIKAFCLSNAEKKKKLRKPPHGKHITLDAGQLQKAQKFQVFQEEQKCLMKFYRVSWISRNQTLQTGTIILSVKKFQH